MRFQVKALRDAGSVALIECEALDAGDATRQVAGQGYTVLRVSPLMGWRLRGGAPRFPLILFGQELAVLLKAGVPLVEALETLAQKENAGPARAVLTGLVTTLREGQPLSQAMLRHPSAFPPLFTATVRAAERTGDLPDSLARYVDYQNRLEAVKKKVVNASIYPALL
ncbi:MAG: type II secretion system F family protein, partial [Burkholderiales bacterium]